jgi:polyhydroxybutyrate depolymerase
VGGTRSRRWPAALVMTLFAGLFAGLFVACSGDAKPTLAPAPSTTAPTTTLPVRCDRPAPAGTTVRTGSYARAGADRVTRVHVPPGYTGTKPVALVLNLHGSGSDARAQEALTGMDATADAEGFIVAYPQAAIRSGPGFEWHVDGVPLTTGATAPPGSPDDLAYVVQLLRTLERAYCIDPQRVYATGLSGGARMVSELACVPKLVAAIGPVSGLRYPSPCRSAGPVAVVAFHGTADPIDPFGGHGRAYWTVSVPVAAERWAVHDQCAKPVVTRPVAGVTLTAYPGCAAGAGVELYALQGDGHQWPGGARLGAAARARFGRQSGLDANGIMWSFFAQHPLP